MVRVCKVFFRTAAFLFSISAAAFAAPNPKEAATTFDVKKHGFNFPNYWEGDILTDVPLVGQVDFGDTKYGLCGGMTLAALDTFFAGGTAPGVPDPTGPSGPAAPAPGTPLRSFIYGRQLDSMQDDDAFLIRRLISWLTKPIHTNATGTGLHVLTDRRFKRTIAPEIDAGRPVPLCLVRATALELTPEAFQRNHQVLAIGYRLHDPPDGPKHWDVDIYDPNFPNEVHTLHYHESLRVQTRRIDASGALVTDHDKLGKNVTGSFRAFFNTPYTHKLPFWVQPTPAITESLKALKLPRIDEAPDLAEADAGEPDPLLGDGRDSTPGASESGATFDGYALLARLELLEDQVAILEAALARLGRAEPGTAGKAPAPAEETGKGSRPGKDPPAGRAGKAGASAVRSPAAGPSESGYTITANSERTGRLGRLMVSFPEGSKTSGANTRVFKAGDDEKSLASAYGTCSADLMPGRYTVIISGKRVENVEVRPHADTHLRTGALRVQPGASTEVRIFEPGGKEALTSFYGKADIGLPVGRYEIEIAGQREEVTVTEDQISEF